MTEPVVEELRWTTRRLASGATVYESVREPRLEPAERRYVIVTARSRGAAQSWGDMLVALRGHILIGRLGVPGISRITAVVCEDCPLVLGSATRPPQDCCTWGHWPAIQRNERTTA